MSNDSIIRGEDIESKLLRRSERDSNGCLIWQGAVLHNGYGAIWVSEEGAQRRAHRVAYSIWIGPIPEDMTIDHLCEVKLCIEPSHLEAVTSKENTLRSNRAPATINSKKTHCKHGHEFTEENTRVYNGKRQCITCVNEASRRSYLRKKQKANK